MFLGALVGLFAVASGATLLWWLTQPGSTGPTAAPPAPAPAAGPSMAELKPAVHAQIFTHDAGLTEQDAARLKTHFESNGIPTAIYPHRDRRAPDAAFVGALVTAEKGQIALSAAPYDIRYLFPPDYSEIEGGDPSGFTIGLGYMSTHNEQFRKSEPVEVAESDLRKLLEPGISNVEFQRRLDHLYDRGIAAAPPAEATPRSRQP